MKMKILYLHTMIENDNDCSSTHLGVVPLDRVSDNILEIIRTHEMFRESATFGVRGLGEPEEYEKLVLEDDHGCRIFEYFNKGISYMLFGTEKDRPVFQVFTHFMILQNEGHI